MNDVVLDGGSTEPVDPERTVAPGALLREARERLGLSLADVARHLKLSQRQVDAIEKDNFAALPGPVFVRGFMRNYARLVALDASVLVAAAEATPGFPLPPASATSQTVSQPVISSTVNARRDGPRGKRAWWPVTAILIVAAIALIVFRGRETTVEPAPTEVSLAVPTPETLPSPSPTATDASAVPAGAVPGVPVDSSSSSVALAPAVSAATTATTVPANTTPNMVSTTSTATAGTSGPSSASSSTRGDPTAAGESFASASVGGGAGSGEVRLNFARDAWVEVKDATGSIVFSQLNTAGSERVVRGQPPFQLVVGNASGVKVTYNAREVDLAPHTRTDVARITLE
jgi:cytoskeleton protein RodZ